MVSHVEAIFDFYGQDDSQLSFKKGDHIQVISRLNSGWWDGICKGKRGWFPSNYVVETYIEENQTVPWIPQLDAQGKQYYVDSKTKEASYYPIMKNLNEKVSNSGMEPLPRNWGIKYTHDSKPYYYNKETDETCWSLDEINLETGLLKKRSNSNSFGSINEEISYSTSPKAGELTWEKISNDIYYCLQQLYKSARLNKKESYISHSASIVETIRTMLYASNTAKRDCQIFTNNKALKQLYRHIMDSLSELVVTTKTASQIWPPPDAVSKMQQAANNVHLSVKNFIKMSKELNLPLDIGLVEDSNSDDKNDGDRADETQQNSSKIISQLEEYSRTISESTQKLNKTVRTQENVSSELIITETRNIVIDVGDFLTVIDEINYDMLNNEIVVDFKTNRLTVCNRIYGLVMTTQNIVNTLRPSNFEEQILLSTELIEKAIKELVISTKCLLQEKENVDQYQKIYYDYNRRASASSEASLVNSSASSNDTNNFSSPASVNVASINNNTSINNTASLTRNRRAMSMDVPDTEYPDFEENGQARNRTFSQRSLPSKLTENFNNMYITNPHPRKSSSHSVSPIQPPPLYYDQNGVQVEIDQFSERKTSAKLMQLLGSEVTNAPPKKKWYLEYDYDVKDLLFNMDGKVKGGTFEALVERLTCHDSFDANFTNTFLLTYRSFCTTIQFMSELLKRYLLPQPAGLTDINEVNEWHEKKLKPIRLRVCNVVKSWLEYAIETDEEDQKAFNMAKEFFDRQIQSDPTFLTVSKLLDRFDKGFTKGIAPSPGREAPVPIIPKSFRHIRFNELDPTEIARQLTLMCSKLYNQIQPVECLNKAWSQKINSPAVNIKMMIEMSNQVTGWVAITILKETDLKKRASIMKHFIYIAEKCYALNNFNTLMSILAGFSSAPIHRLRRTWDFLSNKNIATLDSLNKTMDRNKNFSTYREQLHSVNPPCVPFLGVYLTDLTFIDDGNSNNLKNADGEVNEKLINFSKRSKTADVIREIQQYQNQVYCLQDVPELQNWLKESLVRIEDESDMYNMSLSLEPIEREDEKLARLLIESGFI
ncbi:ras GEF [Piromyces finnis]|uniref:Ras GEF n=1 Tax=Piromyces finnis TaxID=1754191 RepID=A0A1Y1UJ91_9FUNG|nr:ras GEF [Piromyces finnis]|eukprot:ORX38133.1 ras GEF [Piromyces finnis]